jgi:Fe-S-cluster containining protein
LGERCGFRKENILRTDSHGTHCIRCGECCLRSSPTLQQEDVRLLRDGLIQRRDLYTIRIGELVRDNINNQFKISEEELIKIKEKDVGEGCIYYNENDKACRIYDHRPAQCSALACWDEGEFMRVYKGPRLARPKIIDDNILLGLIEQHEKKCSYRSLEKLVKQIEVDGEKAVEAIIALLRFDQKLRPFVSEKLEIDPNEMDFVFGRPLTETITMFGLQVTSELDGSFFLTVYQGS